MILKNGRIRVHDYMEGPEAEIIIESTLEGWERIRDYLYDGATRSREESLEWMLFWSQQALNKNRYKSKSLKERSRKNFVDGNRILAALIYENLAENRRRSSFGKFKNDLIRKTIEIIKITNYPSEGILYFTKTTLSEKEMKSFYIDFIKKGRRLLNSTESDIDGRISYEVLFPLVMFFGFEKETIQQESVRKIFSSIATSVNKAYEDFPWTAANNHLLPSRFRS